MNDLTVVYITANQIPMSFANDLQVQLLLSIDDAEIISVSKEPIKLGTNIVSPFPRSHLGIYHDALLGVKEAKTKYVAIAEDDVLYVPEHFKIRPSNEEVFAYNMSTWSIFTWSEPAMFNHSARINHGMLICARDLYIKAIEERFAKFPDESKIDINVWAEPGKYERQLGVTQYKVEPHYTHPPNIMFTHEAGLSYNTIGTRKRPGKLRAYDIPFWGKASEVVKLYE